MKVLKRANEVKSATYKESDHCIDFESIDTGFGIFFDPFHYVDKSDVFDDVIGLSASRGSTYYSKEIDKELLKAYEESKKNGTKFTGFSEKMKNDYKKIGPELFKAAKDFDKAIEGIMKKHGYTKTKD